MLARLLLGLCLAARLVAADAPVLAPPPSPAALFDPDPLHVWNRLHTAFYHRDIETLDMGKIHPMGPDILDPPLGIHPRFLLDDAPFAQANAILDEFLAAHAEKLIADPLRRVVLQRDLWAVFDLLQAEEDGGMRNFGDDPGPFTPTQQQHRATLSGKVARLIAALALPRAQIEALPNTYVLAVKSGAFPTAFGGQEKADYLPADLFAEKSPWLEATSTENLTLHAQVVDGRSSFRIFYRPPAEAAGAAKFAEWVREEEKVRASGEEASGQKWDALTMSVPLGTQFLLLRELIAVDDQWNLVPTHVVETVQVRVFRDPPPAGADAPLAPSSPFTARNVRQLFEEFDLHRRELFAGQNGGLKATAADEPRHMGYSALGRLAVNRAGRALAPDPFPQNCFVCHVGSHLDRPGASTMQILSFGQRPKLLPPPWTDAVARATIRWKAQRADFRHLRELGTASAPAGGK
jgi:hypothetical protein